MNNTLSSLEHLKLERRTVELAIINEIAQALNGSIDLNQALQITLGLVAELLDLQTGWIWLLNEETGTFYLAAEQNLPPALSSDPARMEGSCYCLDTYRSGDMDGVANINVVSCSRLKNLMDDTAGLVYHASVPLYAHGNQLGVLNVASSDWRELSTGDLRLLQTVGDMLGIAIERTRLFGQSQQLGVVSERNRLAREIHDTLAQGLVAISLQLEAADALLEDKPSSAESAAHIKAFINRALETTRQNLDEARRSVTDLRATPLDGYTLSEALARLADDAIIEQGIKINLHLIGRDIPLLVSIETGLYRIAQEALANIRCHAQAQSVEIALLVHPDQAELTIRDDGRGFDLDEVSYNRYGIIGMNERANLLGGELKLESSHGDGTRIMVRIPLNKHLTGQGNDR